VTDQRERLPWWRYLGPWELRPWAVATLYFFFAGFATVTAALAVSGDYPTAVVQLLPSGIAGTALVLAVLWLGRRIQQSRGLGLLGYLVVVFGAALLSVMVRPVLGSPLAPVLQATPGGAIAFTIRAFGFLLVVLAILGLVTRRLQHQVDRAEAALALSREQQEWMIAADERVRGQVADALHDRVQAGIIAACLQLQTLPTSDPAARDRVIQRLEDLRRIHVRGVARALSPAVSEVGLSTALEDLAAQYEPGMVARITVDQEVDLIDGDSGVQVRLGAYRVVEQSLLNAAGHGRARSCSVDVRLDGGVVHVRVRDDGVGLAPGVQRSGLGSALMTTWARALDGSWSMAPAPGGGVEVRADLRVPEEPARGRASSSSGQPRL